MRHGGGASDPTRMQRPCNHAESRILVAVHHVTALTDAEPMPTARERLRGIVGYRMYRALVVSLVP
jgi:hypothetical protein